MPRGKERQVTYVVERLPDGRSVVRAVPVEREEKAPAPEADGQVGQYRRTA